MYKPSSGADEVDEDTDGGSLGATGGLGPGLWATFGIGIGVGGNISGLCRCFRWTYIDDEEGILACFQFTLFWFRPSTTENQLLHGLVPHHPCRFSILPDGFCSNSFSYEGGGGGEGVHPSFSR